MKRSAFMMIELVFVIVVMGIIGKFGVEFLMNAYRGYIDTVAYNRMQTDSEMAVNQIAKRLQYRIRPSVVVREGSAGNYVPLADVNDTHTVLEWVGYDIDGWRGTWNADLNMSTPNWSGFIDVDNPDANITNLVSPMTSKANTRATIQALSYGSKTEDGVAIFFLGANTQIDQFGWGGVINDQNETLHPVNVIDGNLTVVRGSFDQSANPLVSDVYEHYQLAWSAYAIEHNKTDNTLWLHYNYQPWNGESIADARHSLLMENVSLFTFKPPGRGSESIKVKVCVLNQVYKDDVDQNNSTCKEKAVF